MTALRSLREELRDALPAELRAGGLRTSRSLGELCTAEMSALLEAARRGVAVQDATLYCTTFPCHNWRAANLIRAGIGRIVFVEPYTRAEPSSCTRIRSRSDRPSARMARWHSSPSWASHHGRYREMFDARRPRGTRPREAQG